VEAGATNADIGHSFWKGFFLQFVNFKIILWGITAFTSFILPYYSDVSVMIGFVFLLTVIGDGSTHIWAVAGTVLSGLLKKYWRTANIGMAVILVICAVQLVLE
jgi:cysteine/O-acetylserine efflux protein